MERTYCFGQKQIFLHLLLLLRVSLTRDTFEVALAEPKRIAVFVPSADPTFKCAFCLFPGEDVTLVKGKIYSISSNTTNRNHCINNRSICWRYAHVNKISWGIII